MATTAAPLTNDRMVRLEQWRFKQFTLKANETAFKGGVACVKQADGKVYAANQSSGYVPIGLFAEQKTSTSDTLVNVDLIEEKTLVWFDNATSSDAVVAATDFGKACYFVDDHTVTITNIGSSDSVAGRVWGVSADGKQVLVELGKAAF